MSMGAMSADAQGFVSSLSRTLREANRFIVEKMTERGMEGLVSSHGDILVALFDGQPLSMQELAARIHRDPSTVTALVKRLVKEGYAHTERSAADHRVVEVLLTKKGEALRGDFDAISKELLAVQMQNVDEGELHTACAVLRQVQQNLVTAVQGATTD